MTVSILDETVLWRGAFAMFTNTNLLKLYPTHGALFHAGWLPNMQKREQPQLLPFLHLYSVSLTLRQNPR